MTAPPLPCLLCRTPFTFQDDEPVGPSGSLLLVGHGGYQSALFDPDDGLDAGVERRSLRVLLCDRCLVDASRAGLVQHVHTLHQRPTTSVTPWTPEDEAPWDPGPDAPVPGRAQD
ncbi:hypothetical protein ACFO3K_13765 [Cellulomonas algicola]|nr:hypothetical protein [Cellulomonas algicola]